MTLKEAAQHYTTVLPIANAGELPASRLSKNSRV